MQRYMKGFYEQVPTVYVPTPYIQTKMEGEGFGLYNELRLWGRGCDLKIFRPDRRSESFRAAKGVQPDDVIVLWVGRMVPEKRPDVWLSVVRRLQAEGVNIKPMVVGIGDGSSSRFYERKIKKVEQKAVHLQPGVNHPFSTSFKHMQGS